MGDPLSRDHVAWSPRPVEFFEAAIGRPTFDPAAVAVVEALGGVYDVGDYTDRNSFDYDPDVARSQRWEFPRVPQATFYPTHVRVLQGVVVAMTLSPALVTGSHKKAVTLALPAEVEEAVLWYGVSDGSRPLSVVRRGHQLQLLL